MCYSTRRTAFVSGGKGALDNISLYRAHFSALPSDPDNCGAVPYFMYPLSAITDTLQMACFGGADSVSTFC